MRQGRDLLSSRLYCRLRVPCSSQDYRIGPEATLRLLQGSRAFTAGQEFPDALKTSESPCPEDRNLELFSFAGLYAGTRRNAMPILPSPLQQTPMVGRCGDNDKGKAKRATANYADFANGSIRVHPRHLRLKILEAARCTQPVIPRSPDAASGRRGISASIQSSVEPETQSEDRHSVRHSGLPATAASHEGAGSGSSPARCPVPLP